MGTRGVALGGGGIGDDRPQYDESRALRLVPGILERAGDRLEVIALIDVQHLPAVGLEAGAHIFPERDLGMSVDRDVVVVVDQVDAAQPEKPRHGSSLAPDAFHQVAIAHDTPDPVMHHLMVRAVEPVGQNPLGDGHTDRVRDALAQRAGGHLDAGRVPPLGMPGRARAPLAEVPDLLHGEIVSRQVEQGIQQHGRVPIRQNEPVPVRPLGIARIEPQEASPQDPGGRSQRHRRARMSGVGPLHRVHSQGSDGVDAAPCEVGIGAEFRRGLLAAGCGHIHS